MPPDRDTPTKLWTVPRAASHVVPRATPKKWSILPIDLVFLQALKFMCGIS